MIALLIAVLMVVLPLLHLAFSKMPRTPERVVHILLLYALVFGVGIIGLPMGFIPHVFFPDQTAESIGWPTGSPFQFEVGLHDGAFFVFGSAACFGSRPGSAGRFSCSAPPMGTSARL
jgi:Family of unknown function (DUF6790)